MEKVVNIEVLGVGARFYFPHAPKTFRNLSVSAINEGSVTVRGEQELIDKEDKKVWRPLGVNYVISCKSPVARVEGKAIEIGKRKRGRPKGSKNRKK